jgi:hypothetical protein
MRDPFSVLHPAAASRHAKMSAFIMRMWSWGPAPRVQGTA